MLIKIVGTSHIAPASIKTARATILKLKPDCVALELDPERLAALRQRRRAKPSLRNPMYWLLSTIQTRLGAQTGVLPGAEMLAAVNAAKKVNAKVALIDMPIAEIMGKLSAISIWEKFKLVFKLISGFIPWFGRSEIDLKKVPPEKIIDEALCWMRKELPSFYRVLITERNIYMANWIRELRKRHKRIVVVVGAGHKQGLEKLLKSLNVPKGKK